MFDNVTKSVDELSAEIEKASMLLIIFCGLAGLGVLAAGIAIYKLSTK